MTRCRMGKIRVAVTNRWSGPAVAGVATARAVGADLERQPAGSHTEASRRVNIGDWFTRMSTPLTLLATDANMNRERMSPTPRHPVGVARQCAARWTRSHQRRVPRPDRRQSDHPVENKDSSVRVLVGAE
jgi:hypothetical protein